MSRLSTLSVLVLIGFAMPVTDIMARAPQDAAPWEVLSSVERLEVDAARLWGRNGCGGRSPSPPALAWSLLLASWSLLGAQRREITLGMLAALPVNRALCPWDDPTPARSSTFARYTGR